MPTTKQNAIRATFKVKGLSADLRVVSFEGEEEISRLFRFSVLLATEDNNLNLAKVVRSDAVLSIGTDDGPRHVHGVVAHIRQQDTGRKFTLYRAVLVPAAWQLQHTRDYRIFEKQSVKQIVSAVLGKHGIQPRARASGAPFTTAREYCVQYGESDWDFVCRLLEEAGCCYYFEHSESSHVMHVVDNPRSHGDIVGPPEVRYKELTGQVATEEHVFRFYHGAGLQAGMASLVDYNYLLPAVSMSKSRQASAHKDLEVYESLAGYDDPSLGKELAQVRLNERQAASALGEGQSSCTRFVPGFTFTLAGHARGDLNIRYLLTRVHHRGTKGSLDLDEGALDSRCSYGNSFCCINREVPYPAPRVTRKPMVQGVETAVVQGEGEEIMTDQHGRVRVQFHWERASMSSCWARVSQISAGQGWGALWIPRAGHEVVVSFVGGDPDRPLITGSVYHAQNTTPYSLPDKQTVSTFKSNSSPGGGGFNELRFEDRKDAEEIFLHAQKDHNVKVLNDATQQVGNDKQISVTANRTEEVGGDAELKVTGNLTETVSGDTKHDTTMTIKIKAGTELKLEVGSSKITMTNSGIVIEALQVDVKATANATVKANAILALKGALVKSN